ncbi:SDR family oxidoreductase [Herbiconiux moechotypicola]|nr:SDR family oxidoreductase [Herbiconiux moechotypicola]MCS5729058.1 SDR family oxidoreductase [Herbiconiux moechotypicola]
MTMTYRGTRALITGASSGLGAEFARRLAGRGADLVLVARRADRLEALAAELKTAHGVTVTVLPADLTAPDAAESLHGRLAERGIAVQTLVNNAGFGVHGPVLEAEPGALAAEIQLNIGALVALSRAFLPELVSAARGGASTALVNVASTAAYQPTPMMAVYGASKAFVLSFTEALAWETRESRLKVLALSPGATRTEFFDVVGTEAAAVGSYQTSEQVVETALRALDRRRTPASVISGRANAVTAGFAGVMPRSATLAVSGRLLARD